MDISLIKISDEERKLLSDFIGEDIGSEIDFNRLMPVVEKIESLGYRFSIDRSRVMIFQDVFPWGSTLDLEKSGGKKIESTYQKVVEFVKWYNTQNRIE